MMKKNSDLKELSRLITHFFEHPMDIPKDVLYQADDFIFGEGGCPEVQSHPELSATLRYLKQIKERNFHKDLNELVGYYEKGKRYVDELFDKYEQSLAEEKLSLVFRTSCETFLVGPREQKEEKAASLYYPVASETGNMVSYENVTYRDSLEEEKQYLAKIKGNLLIKESNGAHIYSERNDQLILN